MIVRMTTSLICSSDYHINAFAKVVQVQRCFLVDGGAIKIEIKIKRCSFKHERLMLDISYVSTRPHRILFLL
jgi:hypothetical protein